MLIDLAAYACTIYCRYGFGLGSNVCIIPVAIYLYDLFLLAEDKSRAALTQPGMAVT